MCLFFQSSLALEKSMKSEGLLFASWVVGMSKRRMEKAKKVLYKGRRGENVKEHESIRSWWQGAGDRGQGNVMWEMRKPAGGAKLCRETLSAKQR